MEKQPHENSMDFFRHSIAGYETNKNILKSEDPQQKLDTEEQIYPDLTEEGKELANEKAEEYFNNLNPETDKLFFVSSSQVRAIETANIFKEVAKEKGFEIIKPKDEKLMEKDKKDKLSKEVSGGDVRVVKNLSLTMNNVFASEVFVPSEQLEEINWEAIDDETKNKWEEARKIIEADDKGSWGANFYHHSDKIQKIFPELKTAKDVHNTDFKNILRLIKFANRKIEDVNSDKNIKVIAFGHESYMGIALDKYFGEHQIKNCESVNFRIEDDEKIIAKFKGRESEVE